MMMAEEVRSGNSFIDTEFATTKYGLLRIAQFAFAFLGLISAEIPRCAWKSSVSFYVFVASSVLIFSILVIIIFCTKLFEQISRYINLPLSLLVSESIFAFLWMISSIIIVFTHCNDGLKVGYIIAAILGILGAVALIYSAQVSYNWFRSGSLSAV